jgi:hypothetical protein
LTVNGKALYQYGGRRIPPSRVKVITAQRAPHFYDPGNEKIVMKKLFAIVAVATVVTLTESAVFAMVKHHSIASERPADERLNRSNLYQSDAQGNQPYPNPDRELYAPDTTPPD